MVESLLECLCYDESKFGIFGSKTKVYDRRRVNKKYIDDRLVPTVKHGDGSVMVWGSFSGSIVGDLVEIDGMLNGESY